MTYIEYILKEINKYEIGIPVFLSDLAEGMAKNFRLSKEKASAAVSVCIKRILERSLCPSLRCYQKGIYFLTEATPFGEVGVDKELIVKRKYLSDNSGYETEYFALSLFGLTTQIPGRRVIATNKAKECIRAVKDLDIYIKPPKLTITKDNKQYLQFLDVLEIMDKAPIDAEEPYDVLSKYIKKADLRYDKLLCLADKYYPKNTVLKIAHIAGKGDYV